MKTILIVLTFLVLGCQAKIDSSHKIQYNCKAQTQYNDWTDCNCRVGYTTRADCKDGKIYFGIPISFNKE